VFKEVLEKDPKNLNAIDGIGSILFQMAALRTSQKCLKNPRNTIKCIFNLSRGPEPYYWIGVIDWTLSFRGNGELRKEYNEKNLKKQVKENDALPASIRGDYVTKYGSMIDEGTESLKKAIELRPDLRRRHGLSQSSLSPQGGRRGQRRSARRAASSRPTIWSTRSRKSSRSALRSRLRLLPHKSGLHNSVFKKGRQSAPLSFSASRCKNTLIRPHFRRRTLIRCQVPVISPCTFTASAPSACWIRGSRSSSPSSARIAPPKTPGFVRRAYEIASERHRDQLRRSGDPYMTHLLEVAHILADMRMDATTLTALFLHDVVEDTEFPVSPHSGTLW